MMLKTKYYSVWISDVHLGCKASKVSKLLNFLDSFDCKKLYLVGDIIDLIKLKKSWYWISEYDLLLEKINSMAKKGTEVIFLLGNHDYNLETHSLLKKLEAIKIKKNASHTTLSGDKLLVMHGDIFDKSEQITNSRVLKPVSDVLKIYKGSPASNLVEHTYVTVFYNGFIERSTAYAKKNGYSGIITGHMHNPKISEKNGIAFYNTGDWLYSCSAIVETLDSELKLIKYERYPQKVLE